MALHPLLQSLCELKIVRATHGVLTNARPDHLDVMGPKEENVAEALASTVPVKGLYFTAEDKHLGILRYAAKDRKSKMHTISQHEIDSITDDEINQFIYSEFKVNVALALKVVMSLGVERNTALQGMYDADPDPGAMTE